MKYNTDTNEMLLAGFVLLIVVLMVALMVSLPLTH